MFMIQIVFILCCHCAEVISVAALASTLVSLSFSVTWSADPSVISQNILGILTPPTALASGTSIFSHFLETGPPGIGITLLTIFTVTSLALNLVYAPPLCDGSCIPTTRLVQNLQNFCGGSLSTNYSSTCNWVSSSWLSLACINTSGSRKLFKLFTRDFHRIITHSVKNHLFLGIISVICFDSKFLFCDVLFPFVLPDLTFVHFRSFRHILLHPVSV